MTEKEFESEAVRFAHEFAAGHGYMFDDGAEAFVAEKLAAAAREAASKSPAEQRAVLAQAQAATSTLIAAMIGEIDNIPNYRIEQPGKIGELTLGRALRPKTSGGTCPSWPFC